MCDNWNNHYEQNGDFNDLYPYENNDHDYLEIASDCKDTMCLGRRLVKCGNWDFCHSTHPGDLISCWGGLCLHCAMSIGTLEFKNADLECPICYNVHNRNVCYPHCNHEFCIDCLRTMLYGSLEQLSTIRDRLAAVRDSCESCQHECDNCYPDCAECSNPCGHDTLEEEMRANIPFVRNCPFCRVAFRKLGD